MQDESGSATVEYGVIAALVSLVAVNALVYAGDGIADVFVAAADAVEAASQSLGKQTGDQPSEPWDPITVVEDIVTDVTDPIFGGD